MTCTGHRYTINPDAPEEGTDIAHDGKPCPAHPTTTHQCSPDEHCDTCAVEAQQSRLDRIDWLRSIGATVALSTLQSFVPTECGCGCGLEV